MVGLKGVVVVGKNGSRGRAIVMGDGTCHLLPLGLHVRILESSLKLILTKDSGSVGFTIVCTDDEEFTSGLNEMIDKLSAISEVAGNSGKLSWRGTVGNTVTKFSLNVYMQLRPDFFKLRWSSLENLRETLSDLYKEEVLPLWGQPETDLTEREVAANYFKEIFNNLIAELTVRKLSYLLDVGETQIGRIANYGKISPKIYVKLTPLLVKRGYSISESNKYLVDLLHVTRVVTPTYWLSETLATALATVRITGGMDNQSMSKVMEISPITYRDYEAGIRPIVTSDLAKVVDYFKDSDAPVDPLSLKRIKEIATGL